MIELLAGLAEFSAWIAFIYFLASATAGRAWYALAIWADEMVAKFDD